MRKLMMTTMCVLFVAGTALGDWNPGDDHKMHFPQLPDLSTNGLDVLATFRGGAAAPGFGKILADDWQCSESGPVTDIHIWGSWLNDLLPHNADGTGPDPRNVRFKLSIHADIKADVNSALPWSHPGEELWREIFEPGDPRVVTRLYATNVQEQFYDPNLDAQGQNPIIGGDTEVYQYNFFLDPANPDENIFHQDVGTIYWLDVQAWPEPDNLDPQAVFGWKSTPVEFNWNDDAVFGDNDIFGEPPNAPPVPDWTEMFHPFTGESLNLSFVITPEPATLSLLVLGGIVALRRRRRR